MGKANLLKPAAKRGRKPKNVVTETNSTPKKEEPKKEEPVKTAKELATAQGEPYVSVVSMDVDPDTLHQGSFELDWNEMFIKQLMMSGYRGETDEQIVDQWFQDVCRNVVLETWEQNQADPVNRTKREDLGNGRTAVS